MRPLLFLPNPCSVQLPSDTGLTIAQRSAKSERLAGFIRTLKAQKEPLAEFDERLWGAMVDYVTVGADKRLTVMFREGTSVDG